MRMRTIWTRTLAGLALAMPAWAFHTGPCMNGTLVVACPHFGQQQPLPNGSFTIGTSGGFTQWQRPPPDSSIFISGLAPFPAFIPPVIPPITPPPPVIPPTTTTTPVIPPTTTPSPVPVVAPTTPSTVTGSTNPNLVRDVLALTSAPFYDPKFLPWRSGVGFDPDIEELTGGPTEEMVHGGEPGWLEEQGFRANEAELAKWRAEVLTGKPASPGTSVPAAISPEPSGTSAAETRLFVFQGEASDAASQAAFAKKLKVKCTTGRRCTPGRVDFFQIFSGPSPLTSDIFIDDEVPSLNIEGLNIEGALPEGEIVVEGLPSDTQGIKALAIRDGAIDVAVVATSKDADAPLSVFVTNDRAGLFDMAILGPNFVLPVPSVRLTVPPSILAPMTEARAEPSTIARPAPAQPQATTTARPQVFVATRPQASTPPSTERTTPHTLPSKKEVDEERWKQRLKDQGPAKPPSSRGPTDIYPTEAELDEHRRWQFEQGQQPSAPTAAPPTARDIVNDLLGSGNSVKRGLAALESKSPEDQEQIRVAVRDLYMTRETLRGDAAVSVEQTKRLGALMTK